MAELAALKLTRFLWKIKLGFNGVVVKIFQRSKLEKFWEPQESARDKASASLIVI